MGIVSMVEVFRTVVHARGIPISPGFRFKKKDSVAGMERDGTLWLLSFPSFFKHVRIADLFHLLFKMNAQATFAFSVTPSTFISTPFFARCFPIFFFSLSLPLSLFLFSLFALTQPSRSAPSLLLSIGRISSFSVRRAAGCGFSSEELVNSRLINCILTNCYCAPTNMSFRYIDRVTETYDSTRRNKVCARAYIRPSYASMVFYSVNVDTMRRYSVVAYSWFKLDRARIAVRLIIQLQCELITRHRRSTVVS